MTFPVRAVTVATRVAGDPGEVFAFVSDTRNDPMWCPNVSSVEQVEGDGVDVGSRFRFHQTVQARGRSLESDVDVTVVELGEGRILWEVEDRFQTRAISLTVAGDHGESLVTQTTRASFKRKPGLARWAYPIMARRVFRDQLRRLAEHFG
ncbi:MAG: SRPBCC family protein [Acidimicrobiia bacterium]